MSARFRLAGDHFARFVAGPGRSGVVQDMPQRNLRDRYRGFDYQPHWLWAVILILIPLILDAISFWGIPIGSRIPYGVAGTAPAVALVISCVGMAVSLLQGHRVLISLAAIGLTISTGALLMLLWVTSI